ncbi:cytochrome c-type biogenesis protein CcmH [Gemmatimonadota bacterium]
MKRSRISGGVALFLLLPLVPAGAQQVPVLDEPIQPHPEGEAAINQLRSPFCPGLMLEVCPTAQAKLLRDSLQMMAWDGASSDSLVAWMLATHGEEYRAVPLTRGTGLFAWVMPPLALLAGLLIVALALKHFRPKREEAPVPVEDLSQEDESALAAALQELKASEEVPF